VEIQGRLPRGRLLGLDVGDRRIGVAISDPEQRLAVSRPTLERDVHGREIEVIAGIVREDEVAAVVVGLPLSLSGERGAQAEKVSAFATDLERRLLLPLFLWDERLSTQEAERVMRGDTRPGRRDRRRRAPADTDAVAATIILQAFLDSLRFWERGT